MCILFLRGCLVIAFDLFSTYYWCECTFPRIFFGGSSSISSSDSVAMLAYCFFKNMISMAFLT